MVRRRRKRERVWGEEDTVVRVYWRMKGEWVMKLEDEREEKKSVMVRRKEKNEIREKGGQDGTIEGGQIELEKEWGIERGQTIEEG